MDVLSTLRYYCGSHPSIHVLFLPKHNVYLCIYLPNYLSIYLSTLLTLYCVTLLDGRKKPHSPLPTVKQSTLGIRIPPRGSSSEPGQLTD